MTRIVRITKTGGPEVLKLETINLDQPNPDEVLIEHKAIGLNFIDTYHRSGLYPIELPSGIGAEGAGIIKKIGSKVKDFSIGDHIAYAGAPLGAYSSERNYPTKNLVKIPEEINFNVAATLMTKGLTAYYLLYKTYPISPNETLLFHAAAGGVGQIFCQWAKSLGCKVIGTVGALQFEVIQYRLEHEYGAKCTYENLNVFKATWVEAEDEKSEEFKDFKRLKSILDSLNSLKINTVYGTKLRTSPYRIPSNPIK